MPVTIDDAMIGEIGIFPSEKIPEGWMPCDGQILPVNQYQALASLLGATYGGDGTTTFALPDLRGRVPIHNNSNNPGTVICQVGKALGEVAHVLTPEEIPAHNHKFYGSANKGTLDTPADSVLATAPVKAYGSATDVSLNSAIVTEGAQAQPHQNMQPYLTLCFCILTVGMYPDLDW